MEVSLTERHDLPYQPDIVLFWGGDSVSECPSSEADPSSRTSGIRWHVCLGHLKQIEPSRPAESHTAPLP